MCIHRTSAFADDGPVQFTCSIRGVQLPHDRDIGALYRDSQSVVSGHGATFGPNCHAVALAAGDQLANMSVAVCNNTSVGCQRGRSIGTHGGDDVQ